MKYIDYTGELLDTGDVITFQANTFDEVRKAFRYSIDGSLEFWAERNEKPKKPFSVGFNLDIIKG